MPSGKMLVAQGDGTTAAISQSPVGVAPEARLEGNEIVIEGIPVWQLFGGTRTGDSVVVVNGAGIARWWRATWASTA